MVCHRNESIIASTVFWSCHHKNNGTIKPKEGFTAIDLSKNNIHLIKNHFLKNTITAFHPEAPPVLTKPGTTPGKLFKEVGGDIAFVFRKAHFGQVQPQKPIITF